MWHELLRLPVMLVMREGYDYTYHGVCNDSCSALVGIIIIIVITDRRQLFYVRLISISDSTRENIKGDS